VESLSDQFFANPALAANNHVKIAIRNLPDEFLGFFNRQALSNYEAITNVHYIIRGNSI
jgi:hypothetical protein